ncbi:MAG: Hpt domain-containing protein [Pseudomonadota bacterium]
MRNASELLEKLKQGFLADLPDRINAIETDILGLAQSRDFSNDFHEAYRKIHSLKGAGGTHGLAILTTVCHQLEDVIGLAEGEQNKFTPELQNRLLAYVDLLRQSHALIAQGKTDFAAITDRLQQLLNSYSAHRGRVLIVDASKLTQEMCAQAVVQVNAESVVMHDGYQALERLLTEKFDVLITGVEVGVLSGPAMIAAVKMSGGVNRDIPAIVITSSGAGAQDPKRRSDPTLVVKKGRDLAERIQAEVSKLLA